MHDESTVDVEKNPYLAPIASENRDPVVKPSGDELAIREKYLPFEATATTIGTIYLIGCGSLLVITPIFLSSEKYLAAIAGSATDTSIPMLRMFTLIGAGVGFLLNLVFGLGLRALINGIRIVAMIFIVLGFTFSLFGQLRQVASGNSALDAASLVAPLALSLYFAAFLGKPETRFVFSREYKSLISRTPSLKASIGRRDTAILSLYLVLMVASTAIQARKMF